jgi:hypothetical protein
MLKSRTVSGNGPVTMSVSFLIPMHEFEWLLPQTVAGRYGHDEVNHERQLAGVEMDNQQAARHEYQQPALKSHWLV